jgi:AraC-like DNA-binding protein
MLQVQPLLQLPGIAACKLHSRYDSAYTEKDVNLLPAVSFPVYSAFGYSDGVKSYLLSSSSILFENENLEIELTKLPRFQQDTTVTLHFADRDQEAIQPFLKKGKRSDAVRRTVKMDYFLHALLSSEADALFKEQCLIDLINAINYNAATPHPSNENAYSVKTVEDAKEFLYQNFSQKIQIADMAAAVYVSVFHFCRLFKRIAGVSPYQFLLAIRMEEAKRLLKQGESVTQAAFSTGFQSLEHFSHAFNRFQGTEPSALRRKVAKP